MWYSEVYQNNLYIYTGSGKSIIAAINNALHYLIVKHEIKTNSEINIKTFYKRRLN